MKLIFLYGLPATGKLTVGQELAALTNFKLFHNHLVVDLLLAIFEFGSPSFIQLREEIWLSVFDHAARNGVDGLIFTFAPERTVSPDFIPGTLDLLARSNSEVVFIELTCPLDDLRQRLTAVSRQSFGKLTSVQLFDQLWAEDAFTMNLPVPVLSIDTGAHTPAEAAAAIAATLGITPR